MARKFFMGSSSNTDDPIIDDANDKIYSDETRVIYAITRRPANRSLFLIHLMNKLGELGISDKILARIKD